MSRKGNLFAVMALVAVLVLASVSGVMAQTGTGNQGQNQNQNAGTNPDNAMAPNRQWTALNAGQEHFYAFRYSGNSSNISIRLDAQPQDAVEFAVWTPDQFRMWQNSQSFDPIGRGTANENLNNDLFWQGNFTFQGTYYVVVRNRSQAQASYHLSIEGSGVSFANQAQGQQAQGAQQGQQTGAPSTLPVTGALQQTTPTQGNQGQNQNQNAGTHPGNAMAPNRQWTTLNAGQERFYAFHYTGNSSNISVRLDAQPQDAVEFAVWTPDQFRMWQNSQSFDPIGRGTANENLNNDLFWQGNFTFQGTYYVIVRNRSQAQASYNLSIEGSGVSFANQAQGQQAQGAQQTQGAQQGQQTGAPSTLPVTGGSLD